MTQQDYMSMVNKALLEKNFVPLFKGDEGYSILPNRFIPATIPTDWSILLGFGIYPCFRETEDTHIPELCRKAIYDLLEADAFSIWCGYNVCFFLAYQECENRAPFRILDEELLRKLRDTLHENRQVLADAKIWNGKNLKEGLWTDIVSSAAIPKKRFGIELI